MNDLLFFMAGGLYIFIIAFFISFIEYIKEKLKKNA